MRLPFLFVALSATSLLPAAAGDEWHKQWPVSGKAELRVEVDDGRISVISTDSKQIEARVSASGWKIGDGGVKITERQNGDRVELEVRVPRSLHWVNTGNRSLRVDLRVPRAIVANIRTGDGAIEADGVSGSLRLRSGDGRIEGTNLDGSLDAESGDGAIRVRGRFDQLSLRTGDGSIEAGVQSGSKMASAWDVSTGDGSITLHLPDGFAAEIEARTNDGRVSVDLPLTLTRGDHRSEVRGKLNGGGPKLKVHTGDGGIRLGRS